MDRKPPQMTGATRSEIIADVLAAAPCRVWPLLGALLCVGQRRGELLGLCLPISGPRKAR